MIGLGLRVSDRGLDSLEVFVYLADDLIGVRHEADVSGTFDALELRPRSTGRVASVERRERWRLSIRRERAWERRSARGDPRRRNAQAEPDAEP